MNSLDIKIRESLACYLTNEISFEEFEDWFMPATWEIEKTSNLLAIELTHEIELRISEFTNGHFTEKELREKLGPFTQRYSVQAPPREPGDDSALGGEGGTLADFKNRLMKLIQSPAFDKTRASFTKRIIEASEPNHLQDLSVEIGDIIKGAKP